MDDVDVFISAIRLGALHHNFIIITIPFFLLWFMYRGWVCVKFWLAKFFGNVLAWWKRTCDAVFVRICIGCAQLNYFILVFQFRNDNNNLPAAKPKIKFTPIQCRMEFVLSVGRAALFVAGDYLQFCSVVYLCAKFFMPFDLQQNLLLNNFSVLPTLYAYMHVCLIVCVCIVAQFTNIHLYICNHTFIKFQT